MRQRFGWTWRQVLGASGALACLMLFVGTRTVVAEPSVPPSTASANAEPFPSAARALNLPGHVTLKCIAAADGNVRDCSVADEEPTGWGFGSAALDEAATVNVGLGVADREVQVPLDFRLNDAAVTDPWIKTPGFSIEHNQQKWAQIPRWQDFLSSYPRKAYAAGRNARALVGCRVTAKGELRPCVLLAQDSNGEDLQRSVDYLVTRFRLAPRLKDGRSVENGVVKFYLTWTLGRSLQ